LFKTVASSISNVKDQWIPRTSEIILVNLKISSLFIPLAKFKQYFIPAFILRILPTHAP